MKCFHVRDGAGIVQLLRAGVQIAVISGRQSRAVERRMTELGVTWIRQGIEDKLAALRELLDILGLGPQAVASIGDDSADLPIFEVARLAIAVADAHASVKSQAHFITQAPGGQGAVREICDLILEAQRRRSSPLMSWRWISIAALLAAVVIGFGLLSRPRSGRGRSATAAAAACVLSQGCHHH